jgi:hypothetical protein
MVLIIIRNLCSRTIAQEFTQPLTEMNAKSRIINVSREQSAEDA